ncbi:hypothetical protein CC79DRAFT_358686 [Sarocladium strictum]
MQGIGVRQKKKKPPRSSGPWGRGLRIEGVGPPRSKGPCLPAIWRSGSCLSFLALDAGLLAVRLEVSSALPRDLL